MNYSELQRRIDVLVTGASEDARYRFGALTIPLIYGAAKKAIEEQLTSEERNVLAHIIAELVSASPDNLEVKLEGIFPSSNADPIRPVEFDTNIIQLLDAIDNWIHFLRKGDPSYITSIAINRINVIDYASEGQCEGYSIDNMFASPQMVAEYERQHRLLTRA